MWLSWNNSYSLRNDSICSPFLILQGKIITKRISRTFRKFFLTIIFPQINTTGIQVLWVGRLLLGYKVASFKNNSHFDFYSKQWNMRDKPRRIPKKSLEQTRFLKSVLGISSRKCPVLTNCHHLDSDKGNKAFLCLLKDRLRG